MKAKKNIVFLILALFSVIKVHGQQKKPCSQITPEILFEYKDADKPSKLLFKSEYTFFPIKSESFGVSNPKNENINQYTIYNRPLNVQGSDEFSVQIIEKMICITNETVMRKKTFYTIKPQYATGSIFDNRDEDNANMSTEELNKKYTSTIKNTPVNEKTETLIVVAKNTIVLQITQKEYFSKIKTLKQQGYVYDESKSNDDSFAYKNNKYMIHLIKTTGTPQRVNYHIAYTLL